MNLNRKVHLHGLLKSTTVLVHVGIIILVVIISSGCFVSVECSNQFPVPSAKIALVSLERGQLRTITEKVNHEVVLTVPTKYFEAYLFECNASYPIEWNYVGEGAPTTTADVGRHFKDFYDVTSYTYQSILYMYNLEELQSGRYICRGSNPEQEKLQIHYDLFVPGNGSRLLVSTTEKEVFVPESKLLTALPCEVTDPSSALNLYKGNSWGSFQKLELNQSIIFRARKGFILKLQELPDPFGTYMCTTENNKRRRKIHLIPERLKSKYENSNPLNGKVPVHLSYDSEYNRILCCSGSSFVPKLQWAGCTSVLDCKIKSVCFEEDRCEPRLGHFGDTPHNKWIDPGTLPQGCAGWKLRDDPNGDYGIFKCSTPGVSQYQPYLLNRGNIFLDFEKAPPSEAILTLTKTSVEPIYVGSEVEYHCNSTRFYFAFGIRWAFQRANGDIEFVDDSAILKDRYFLTAHRRQSTFRIMHSDIKGIICFVPIANSPTEWRTVSLPIFVRRTEENFKIPSTHHHGQSVPQDYISNIIPYSSQQSQHFEPHSTSRPKGYFSYQTDNEPQPPVSNVDISDIISFKEKSSRIPGISSDILHEAQDRDYNIHSGRQPPAVAFKFPNEFPSQNIRPEYSADYAVPDSKPDAYVNLQTQHNYEPLFSSGSRIVSMNPQSKYESRNQQQTQFAQSPISNESQDNRNYNQQRNKKIKTSASNSYEKFPYGSMDNLRNDPNTYFSSTRRPASATLGYLDAYVAKINANKNSLETFPSVRTSPTPLMQPEIHFETHHSDYMQQSQPGKDYMHQSQTGKDYIHQSQSGKEYIHQPQTGNLKIFNRLPTLPTLSTYRIRENPSPTLPSNHNSNSNDYFGSGSRPASKVLLPPAENLAALPYSDDYYRTHSRVGRIQSTTISPFYYNFNGPEPMKQSPVSSSWEKSSPYVVKDSVEYAREPQYQNQNQNQNQNQRSSSFFQTGDQSADGTPDENYYFQRYAAESTEFPGGVQPILNRIRPTMHSYSNNDENSVRRSGYVSNGENVPIVELG